jgi:hypothetical protein
VRALRFVHRSLCRVCILESLKQRNSCPHDRGKLTVRSLRPNRAVNNHLSTLIVRCTRAAALTGAAAADVACDWTGALCTLQQHLDSACPLGELTCTWPGCGDSLLRRHIATHEHDACGYRPLTCPHAGCGSVMAAHSLEEHAAGCSHAPLPCPNAGCGALLAHAEVGGHLDVCPAVPMVCAVLGCGVHATRGSMDAHLQADSGRHLALLSGRLLAAEAAVAAADSRARTAEAAAAARILACEERAAAAAATATLADTKSASLERQLRALESQAAARANDAAQSSRKRRADTSAEDLAVALPGQPATLEARGCAEQWTALPISRRTLVGHTQSVWACAFSADGKVVVTGGRDAMLRLWSVDTEVPCATLSGHGDGINACALSPDGTTLMSGAFDAMLKLWSMDTYACRATLVGHTAGVKCCAFSPIGSIALSGSFDGTLRVWNVTTGECLTTLQAYVSACTFGADGTTIAAVNQSCFKSWTLPTGEERDCTNWRKDSSYRILPWSRALSPAGTHFLAACTDHALRLWDPASGECVGTLAGHESSVCACTFSADGMMVASSDDHGTLKLWDARTGACLRTMPQLCADALTVCAFSPDGRTLLAGGKSPQLLSLDAAAP